jgi:hypothetical protein
VNTPVPPEATTEAVPLQAPKQVTFTCDCVFVIAGLAVMLNVAVTLQPAGEEIVHEYVPAHIAVAFAVPCPAPGAGDQLYV